MDPDQFKLEIVRITRSDRTRIDIDDDLMGRGVRFPSGMVVMEWYRGAYPPEDRLDEPHQSIYGSLEDVKQGTGGDVEIEEVL